MTDLNTAGGAALPSSLGPYRIDGEIGSGAMGTVFRATHLRLERLVALKVMRPDTLGDPDAVRRFLREGRSIARLEHPHIVAVYDAGEIDGVYYIAMKLLQGETIETLLARYGPWSTERVVRLASQMAAALHYAHGRGVVHRDVKPANIIVGEGEHATLTDFGIAQAVQAGAARSTVLAGTPLYMAPELLEGHDVDGRSDVYSLGAVLYEMFTGHPPFRGPIMSVMYAHVHSPPPDIRAEASHIPERLAQIVERSLAKDPGARFQTAGQMMQALADVGGEGAFNPGTTVDISSPSATATVVTEPPSVRPPTPSRAGTTGPRSGRRLWLLAPLVALIALGAAAALDLRSGPTSASIQVVTVPAGAHVSVDGLARGRTPLTLHRLSSGSHRVTASLPTYVSRTSRVRLVAGKTRSIRIVLSSLPVARLIRVPEAVLTTSFTRDSASHKIIPGSPVSALTASAAAGHPLYLLVQFESLPGAARSRDIRFNPSYALFDPQGTRFATARASARLELTAQHPDQVWMAAFRLRSRAGHGLTPGRFEVKIMAGGRSVKSLQFRVQ